MKIKRFSLILILIFAAFTTIYADGLGLRTPPPATPTQISTETGADTLKLKLQTEDPLLVAFRNGLATPDIPGWQTVKIAGKDLKIPEGFSLSTTSQGKNTDTMIKDGSDELFARLYVYDLASYTTEELLKDLTNSIYGTDATGKTEYGEFKKLPNGTEAYLTRMLVTDAPVSYPIFFVYTPGEDPKEISQGTVVMLIFEPTNYADAAGKATAERWMEGIAGSVLEAYGSVNPPAKVVSKYADAFAEGLFNSISSKQKLSFPQNWSKYEGETFGISAPDYWGVEFFKNPDMEVADIVESEITIAKVLVGTFDYEYPEDLLRELYDTYLKSLGEYVSPVTEKIQDGATATVVFRFDFANWNCWVMMRYRGSEKRMDSASMFVFIGIAPVGNTDQRIKDYLSLLGSYKPIEGKLQTYDDIFIDRLFKIVQNQEYPDVPLDWEEYEGDTMYVYSPPYWKIKFFPTTDFEVADVNESETTIAKIFFGFYDYETPKELLDHMYASYLDSLGQYTLSKKAYMEDGADSFLVYRLDFKNSHCWVMFVYEGTENKIDTSSEIFAFIGIAPIKSPEKRVNDYMIMLSNWEESWWNLY